MRVQLIKAAAAAALAAAGVACGPTGANQQSTANTAAPAPVSMAAPSPAGETASIRSGKDLYTMHCLTCHKVDGKGGKITVEGKTIDPDDLTSANMKAKTDEKLYSYIAEGIVDEGMPAFKDTLSPNEIRSVVTHVRSLQNR